MTLSWTTNDIDGAAESAHENFAALMSWDELTRWFEPGELRDLRTAERGFQSIRKENLPKISGTRGRKTKSKGTPVLPRNWPRGKNQEPSVMKGNENGTPD
jgi:hypothetical protein